MLGNIQIKFEYQSTLMEATLPMSEYLGSFCPQFNTQPHNHLVLLHKALKQPIGDISPILTRKKSRLSNILIVLSDSFRYTGIEKILQEFLYYLYEHGFQSENIRFAIATGAHRPPSEEELINIMSHSVYSEFRSKIVIPSPTNLDEYSFIGNTSRNTPIYIHKSVMESELIILTGTIVFHYFAGFGGGRKSLVPGLSALPTIQHNHTLSIHPETQYLHPNVKLGKMEKNPVAEDMLEATQMIDKPIITLNTVLSPDKKIVGIFFGELVQAHKEGIKLARTIYETPIPEKADIVIANAGNVKNYLQSHKALVNAWLARKEPHGRIILIAPSIEGIGGYRFENWLEIKDVKKLVDKMTKEGEVNGQTVVSTIEKSPYTYFLTEMSESEVELLGGKKIKTLEEGFQLATEELAKNGITHPKWLYLPFASYSVPVTSSSHPVQYWNS